MLPALQSAVESAMCAITKSLMTDPVIALDGMTYERTAIAEYFGGRERAESPVTREEIATGSDTWTARPRPGPESFCRAWTKSGTQKNRVVFI